MGFKAGVAEEGLHSTLRGWGGGVLLGVPLGERRSTSGSSVPMTVGGSQRGY